MGNVWFDLGVVDKALEHHQKDLEVSEHKLPEPMSRALDNISRVYAQTGQFEVAIETYIWEKKVPLLHGALEKTWLFHELSCCYLMLKKCQCFGQTYKAAVLLFFFTSLLHWDGVLRLASFPLFPPNVMMVIMAKQFSFSFIRPQDCLCLQK
uniref:Uncharacterized protein n=1 Tax=Stegastes partitus TaxID=144197 RepID=A0A3B4ZZB4_9TELE